MSQMYTPPLVSIVLPVYQPKFDHLKCVIESIEKQDYPYLEIILSDDGDTLGDFLRNHFPEFLHRDNVCFVENQGEKGIFGNINNSLNYATGEYVQLFSQDDVMNETFISDQAAIFKQYPDVGMVFCSFDTINEVGIKITKHINYTYRQDADRLISVAEAPCMFLKYGCMPGNISPVMIRRDMIRIIGDFDQSLPYAGDFDYWVRLSERFEIYYRHMVGLQVRKHYSQASQTIPNQQLLKDLTRIYGNLIKRIPKEMKKQGMRSINRKIGAAFLHDTVVGVLKCQKGLRDLRTRILDLKQYPFNPLLSLFYYTLSIPGRLYRKLI